MACSSVWKSKSASWLISQKSIGLNKAIPDKGVNAESTMRRPSAAYFRHYCLYSHITDDCIGRLVLKNLDFQSGKLQKW